MKNKLINIIIIIVLTLVVLYFSLKDNYNEIIKRLNIIKNNNEKIKTLLEFIKILT